MNKPHEYYSNNKEVRRDNRKRNQEVLHDHGIEFVEKNEGAHLIVWNGVADFWPGTGRWVIRETKDEGRGVYALLDRLLEEGDK